MQVNVLFQGLVAVLLLAYISSSVLGQGLSYVMPCQEGRERPCGSAVGVCEKGISTCTEGLWGECEGGVGPADEDCGDGLDNDCNGLVDDCGFNTVSIILVGLGLALLVVAFILNMMGK